jgi:hypothetical protein
MLVSGTQEERSSHLHQVSIFGTAVLETIFGHFVGKATKSWDLPWRFGWTPYSIRYWAVIGTSILIFLQNYKSANPLLTRCIFLIQSGSKLLFLSKRRYAIVQRDAPHRSPSFPTSIGATLPFLLDLWHLPRKLSVIMDPTNPDPITTRPQCWPAVTLGTDPMLYRCWLLTLKSS